jgi:Family of unknown function (DUF6228)
LFLIQSTSSVRQLIFSQHKGDLFHVELKGFDVSAMVEVSAFTDADGLNRLFKEVAALERPWKGRRSWETIERNFSLSLDCTASGIVTVRIEIWELQGGPEEWSLNASPTAEFGQLKQIATNSDAFFNDRRSDDNWMNFD